MTDTVAEDTTQGAVANYTLNTFEWHPTRHTPLFVIIGFSNDGSVGIIADEDDELVEFHEARPATEFLVNEVDMTGMRSAIVAQVLYWVDRMEDEDVPVS